MDWGLIFFLTIAMFFWAFVFKVYFLHVFVKRRPSLFFKWTRFLIRKKWLKVRDCSGGGIEGVFLFDMNTRITCNELIWSPHIEFELCIGYDDIIGFKFNKETKSIDQFSCDKKINIKGNEMLFVKTVQDMIFFGMKELVPKKSKADILFELLQNEPITEEKKVEEKKNEIPETFVRQHHALKQFSSELLHKKELLQTEQIHRIESMMEERIPSLFKELEQLSEEKQGEFHKKIEVILQEVESKFQEYNKQIEEQISFELQKQLKSIKKIMEA